jgi:hypothetical protein
MRTWSIHGREYGSLDEIRERVEELNAAHPGESQVPGRGVRAARLDRR